MLNQRRVPEAEFATEVYVVRHSRVVGHFSQIGFNRPMGNLLRPVQGQILRENRGGQRRTLRLSAQVASPGAWEAVLIRDLSETGLMFETSVELEIGEIVSVDLPFAGQCDARIVWRELDSFGCEFLTPVSQTTISAALLKSPGDLPDDEIETTVEELLVGIKPTLDDLTSWKAEFEQTKGASGYRLVGFRQESDGRTIAMVTKTK